MKSIAPILALSALLTAYHGAGVLWGQDAKLRVAIGMLGLYAALYLALIILRRRLRRERPELAAELDAEVGAPWYWKLLDCVLGMSFAFGPLWIVSLVRRQPLSWEGEFTAYHLLAMAGGVGVYMLGRAYVIRLHKRRNGVTDDAA